MDTIVRQRFLQRLGFIKPPPSRTQRPAGPPTTLVTRNVTRCADVRAKFLRKLSYSDVWVPTALRLPTSQTVIIFDWDDTLLCTSFLIDNGSRVPPSHKDSFSNMVQAACKLLELGHKLGQTFIITNARAGWVEEAARKWAPEFLPVLEQTYTISARNVSLELHEWKAQAFLELQRQFHSQVMTNIVSIGDSEFEIDAAHVMGKKFAQAKVKTILFRPEPTPVELCRELELVLEDFERVVHAAKDQALTFRGG